jgi:hypothetical protein
VVASQHLECRLRIVKVHDRGNACAHEAMLGLMKYCTATPDQGWTLKPSHKWDGSAKHMFVVSGLSDSDYAKDLDTRQSVLGTAVFVEDLCVGARSSTQKIVALSVTEAELGAVTQCAQDMLFTMRVIESLGLQVEKPMIIRVDNEGAHDLAHNWSIRGRTWHIDVRINFLRELKEEGILVLEWISGDKNASDLFTRISTDRCLKNVQLHLLGNPTSLLMLMAAKLSAWEGVEGQSVDHTPAKIEGTGLVP